MIQKTNIPIFINGKVKASIPISVDMTKEEVMAKAMEVSVISDIVGSHSVIKTVYIPARGFNFVVDEKKQVQP